MTPILQFITDFGDQAILLPLAAGIAVVFALSGWRRGAFAWAFAMGSTFGLVLLLKLDLAACAHIASRVRPHSPSGHTAAAAAVYGGLAAIMMRRKWSTKYWILYAIAIALFLAFVFGASRAMLGVHSIAEIVEGGIVGTIGAVSAAVLAGIPAPGVRMSRVVIVGIFVLFALHGLHMPAEAAIRSISVRFWLFPICP